MPATINQNTGRYWWGLIIAFVLGGVATLWVAHPYLCDKQVDQRPGKATTCHSSPFKP